jgi:hypothetical protein
MPYCGLSKWTPCLLQHREVYMWKPAGDLQYVGGFNWGPGARLQYFAGAILRARARLQYFGGATVRARARLQYFGGPTFSKTEHAILKHYENNTLGQRKPPPRKQSENSNVLQIDAFFLMTKTVMYCTSMPF